MGLLETAQKLFTFGQTSSRLLDGAATGAYFDYASSLATIAPALMPPGTAGALDEAAALRCPPVTRVVAMYSAVMAASPLTSNGGSKWLNETAGNITPGMRNAELFQDLFFHGIALLLVVRDADGNITDAVRIRRDLYSINAAGQICAQNGTPVPNQAQFIVIKSLLPVGFLHYAADSLQHYADICATIRSRGANPIPLVEIHLTDEWEGTPEQAAQVQENWSKARSNPNGAVAITPRGIQLITHTADGAGDQAMLIEARNAVRLDIANYGNLNASIVDGNSGASDNYSNTLQDANEFLSLSLGLFTAPIAQRLSQNDVTPAGELVTFDHKAFQHFTDTKGNAVAGAPAPAAPALETGN